MANDILGSANLRSGQPGGLRHSSRGLSAQQRAMPPDQIEIRIVTLKGSHSGTPPGCESFIEAIRGPLPINRDSTPGYFLPTLRVVNAQTLHAEVKYIIALAKPRPLLIRLTAFSRGLLGLALNAAPQLARPAQST